MKHEALRGAEKYTKAYFRKRRWYAVMSCLAAVVVFCTTYALILPAITAEGSTIKETLDGDWAYIDGFKMKSDLSTKSKVHIRTGTAPFDDDDNDGNDSNDLNNRLRTFDTAAYTLQFDAQLRQGELQDVGGIRQGRLYFEFVLPLSTEECRFETDAMGWLTSYPNVKYETVTADVTLDGNIKQCCQVLRGSYTLKPSGTNSVAIPSSNELTVVIRAMKMHNDATIQPTFTLWLQYNDVGVTYNALDDRLPASVVTGTEHTCSHAEHGVEAKSVTAPEITVSARPMFNITLKGVSSYNTKIDTADGFNFNTDDQGTINYDAGNVKGRLNGYGIQIETRGKTGEGMRGMEFPNPSKPITFELKLSSEFQPEGSTVREDVSEGYLPLYWAGDANVWGNGNLEREVSTQSVVAVDCPINNWEGEEFRTCDNGGTWEFKATDKPSVIKVTVRDFTFGTQFPWSNAGGNETDHIFYNPDEVGENWWQIDRAVFSAGRVFIVQPFYDNSDRYICDKYSTNSGQFYTSVEVQNMTAYALGSETPVTAQVVTDDDKRNEGQYLSTPGTIEGYVQYNAYDGEFNNPLSPGAYGNDTDWATVGSKLRLQIEMGHDSADGEFVGVASDNLIKFYGTFFEPELTEHSTPAYQLKVLWGAKPDGRDWENDEEMKRYTADNLDWYVGQDGLEEMKIAGKLPVAALIECRGVLNESSMNHLHTFLYGSIKANCPTNKVYMMVRNSYAWRKRDVAQAALDYYNKKYPETQKSSISELTNGDYNNYVIYGLPTHNPNARTDGRTLGTYYKDGNHDLKSGDFKEVLPFWWQDYYHTDKTGDLANPGAYAESACATATAADYTGGAYKPGNGMYYYQDSCLVMGFKTSVTKQTAQKQSDSTPKSNYDMNQNQRTVDYELTVKIEREVDTANGSTGAELYTVVYVEDTLPKALMYNGSAQLGGEYTQDSNYQRPGTVTGGTLFESTGDVDVNEPNAEHPYLETVTPNEDGTTTIRWALSVHLDLNAPTWSKPIRFSCAIGTPGVEETDVKNGDQIINTAKVWAGGDSLRGFNKEYGNLATFGITVLKTGASSLSKVSDQLVAERGTPMGFTMTVGNNSGTPMENIVIMETLPYNGVNGTSFNGNLVVTEFSAGTTDSAENSNSLLNNFTFYYTTKETYKDYTSAKFGSSYNFNTSDWTKLTLSATANTAQGRPYGVFDNFPTEAGQTNQITAIVAVGDLPANKTLKIHITVELPDGKANDCLFNYLSQGSLSCYARTQVVSRSLEGLVWKDTNANGLQDGGEELLSGVDVSLWKLREGTTFISSGSDVILIFKNNMFGDLNAKQLKKIRIVASGIPAGQWPQLFYATNNPELDETHSKRLQTETSAETEYVYETTNFQDWDGSITNLRWDPMDGLVDQSFTLKSIIFDLEDGTTRKFDFTEEEAYSNYLDLHNIRPEVSYGGNPAVEADYFPYCYPGTSTQVSVQTGKQISVLKSDSVALDYKQGCYKFIGLPEGTFAVKFTNGDTQQISGFISSPQNRGSDDTIDSDGIAIYSEDRSSLNYTWINNIIMKPVKDLIYGTDESKFHDSGFYERGYELPKSGGAGTEIYTVGGFLMFTSAAFVLLNKQKRRSKS